MGLIRNREVHCGDTGPVGLEKGQRAQPIAASLCAWWYGTHCVLDPSDGVFGRFDLAALGGCHTLNVCYVCYVIVDAGQLGSIMMLYPTTLPYS